MSSSLYPTLGQKTGGIEHVESGTRILGSGTAQKLDEVSLVQTEAAFEKHFRIGDLSRLWGLGRETVRKLVKDDPGVIKIRMGRRKAHTIYSVPESVARRIHRRLMNAAYG